MYFCIKALGIKGNGTVYESVCGMEGKVCIKQKAKAVKLYSERLYGQSRVGYGFLEGYKVFLL